MMWGNILRMCAKYCTPVTLTWLSFVKSQPVPGGPWINANWRPQAESKAWRCESLASNNNGLWGDKENCTSSAARSASFPACAESAHNSKVFTCSCCLFLRRSDSNLFSCMLYSPRKEPQNKDLSWWKTRQSRTCDSLPFDHRPPIYAHKPRINLAPGYPRHFRLLFLLGLSHCVGQKMSIPLLSRINAANLLQGFQLTA